MIVTARKLANANSKRKPRQADLRRAISTAYYALFHAFAKNSADMLVGVGQNRPDKAWVQVYRSLQHGDAKSACEGIRNLGFPDGINACGDAFVRLQRERHAADYDPEARLLRSDALQAIELAENAIQNLKIAHRKDRMAFAVQLLHKRRR